MSWGFWVWTRRSPLLLFAAIFSLHSPWDFSWEACPSFGYAGLPRIYLALAPWIYSFTPSSCNLRPSWLWHFVMILTRYFFSGYCMASPWTSISCDVISAEEKASNYLQAKLVHLLSRYLTYSRGHRKVERVDLCFREWLLRHSSYTRLPEVAGSLVQRNVPSTWECACLYNKHDNDDNNGIMLLILNAVSLIYWGLVYILTALRMLIMLK